MTLAERLARSFTWRQGYRAKPTSPAGTALVEVTEATIAYGDFTAAIREALREAAAVLRAQAELVEREYRLVYGTGTCAQAVGLRDGAKLVRALNEEVR